jgi:hypothetical protein
LLTASWYREDTGSDREQRNDARRVDEQTIKRKY